VEGINRVIIKDFDGTLEVLEGRRVSFAVTPEHKLLLKDKNDSLMYQEVSSLSKTSTSVEFPSKFSFAGYRMTEYRFDDGLAADNVPETIDAADLFYMCGLYIGDGHSGTYLKVMQNKTGLRREEYLKQRDGYGRFVACGKIGPHETTKCHKYDNGFCLPEEDPARYRLLEILEKYEVKFYLTKDRVCVSSKRLVEFFKQFGNSAHDKTIPRWMLDAHPSLLSRLFDGLIASDGNHKTASVGKCAEYTTVSERLLPCLMELALKTNHGFTYSKTHSESEIDGRNIEGNAFKISFATANKTVPKNKIRTEKYKGVVWCLDVKDNHNFFVVRNGRLNVFGNCSVYGVNDNLIDEDAEPNPLSAYASTKLAAEQYILKHRKDALIFRLGTLYGLGDDHSRLRLDLVVNILTKKAVEGQKLSVFGGEQWRPLLHVRDVGNAFLYCFQHNISGLYNLAACNMKIVEIAEVIRKVIPEAQIEYKDMKFEDLRNYHVTNRRIQQTGWKPTLELEDGILELQKVFRENRITNLNDPVYSNQAFIKNKFGKEE